MTRTALYRHFDKEGVLLYVGISDCLSERDKQHRATAHWHNLVHHTQTMWLDDRKSARAQESIAIIREKPKHNIQSRADVAVSESSIGARVALIRCETGLSQAEFADLIGVKRSRLSLWECGIQRLSLSGALAINECLGVSLDWLFLGTTPELTA